MKQFIDNNSAIIDDFCSKVEDTLSKERDELIFDPLAAQDLSNKVNVSSCIDSLLDFLVSEISD